jgi:hypothetical protein
VDHVEQEEKYTRTIGFDLLRIKLQPRTPQPA